MSPIVRPLVWKEFQEQKWAAVSAAAVALAIPLSYVFRDTSLALGGVMSCLAMYPLAGGLFFGARAASGERTNRSAAFVAALPISHRVLGTMRLLGALVAAAVPLVLLLALACILNPLTDVSAHIDVKPMMLLFGMAALATAACVTIVSVAGTGQLTEIRAGLVGFAAVLATWIVGYTALLVVLESFSEQYSEQYIEPSPRPEWLVPVCTLIAVSAIALVGTLFVSRYSLALGPFLEANSKRYRLPQWRPHFISSPLWALTSKAIREMGLLALEVLGISLLLSVVAGLLGWTGNGHSLDVVESVTRGLPMILFVGGFVLAVLIGVGAVIGDLQPGVNTFWRSRPISPQSWYWTKYLVGLATMLVAIEIPELLMVSSSSFINEARGVGWWLLVWNATFSFALTATCLVRQPGYAAILSIGGVSVLYAVIEALFGSWTPGLPPAPVQVLAIAFVAAFVGSTVLGWWAAVRDVSVA
jgi:ABC-type transport system involved in multi-copper enzyme maturation permease subunit